MGEAPPPVGATAPRESATVLKRTKRIFRIIVGFTLIVIGALFGLVPLIPGWPLGLAGLTILAGEFVWARTALNRVHHGARRMRDVLWPKRTKQQGPGEQP